MRSSLRVRPFLFWPVVLVLVALLGSACSGVESRVSVTNPFEGSSNGAQATAGSIGDEVLRATPTPAPVIATDEPEDEPQQQSWTSPTPVPARTTLNVGGQMSDCLRTAAAGNDAVLTAFNNNTFDELSIDNRIAGSAALFECAPEQLAEAWAEELSNGFTNTSTMLPYFLGRCLERELSPSNPDSDSLLAGWTYLRAGLAVPAEHQPVLVFTLTICVPDDVMGQILLGEIGYDNPAFLDSASDDCLQDELDGNDLRLFWETFAARPNAAAALEPDAVIPAMSSALRCASVGVMIAQQALLVDGVELSASTIRCIDASLEGVDMGPMYLPSVDSTEVRGLASDAIDQCLSPAERAAGR